MPVDVVGLPRPVEPGVSQDTLRRQGNGYGQREVKDDHVVDNHGSRRVPGRQAERLARPVVTNESGGGTDGRFVLRQGR